MSLVRVETNDGVALVTLDDPKRRNAMTISMCEEVGAALDALEADKTTKAIIVTGAGSAFCAGADLSHLGDSAEDGLMAIYQGFLRFGSCPLPTIAAVNGPAVGAGMNLALICDLVIAAESARFDDRFLQLGIHPGGGHTWMFQNRVGSGAAAASVLFSEVWNGEKAARYGLAHSCVEDSELIDTAREMASRSASVSKELIMATKATMASMRKVATQDEAVRMELGPQAHSASQPEFRAKLAALAARISAKGDQPGG